MRSSSNNENVKGLCKKILSKTEKGISLKEAIQGYQNALGTAYSSLLVAGEEAGELDEILSEIPKRVYASMFVNDETYFAVSNLTGEKYTLKLKGMWKNRETGEVSDSFDIENDGLLLLIKA